MGNLAQDVPGTRSVFTRSLSPPFPTVGARPRRGCGAKGDSEPSLTAPSWPSWSGACCPTVIREQHPGRGRRTRGGLWPGEGEPRDPETSQAITGSTLAPPPGHIAECPWVQTRQGEVRTGLCCPSAAIGDRAGPVGSQAEGQQQGPLPSCWGRTAWDGREGETTAPGRGAGRQLKHVSLGPEHRTPFTPSSLNCPRPGIYQDKADMSLAGAVMEWLWKAG